MILKNIFIVISMLSSFALYGQSESDKNCKINISIMGLSSNDGSVILTFYNDVEDYYDRGDKYFRCDTIPLNDMKPKQQAKVVSLEVEPGRYIIHGYHDENGDGKIQRTLLGSSIEGEGYLGVDRVYRRPKFKDVAIEIKDGETLTSYIKMWYPNEDEY